ncbi:MAG: hypothetical protein WAM28_09215 [Chlamydiales bacterium]
MSAINFVSPHVQHQIHNDIEHNRKREDARITSVALAVIALIIHITSVIMYGLGKFLPIAYLSGLGFMVAFSAVFLNWVGSGVLLGSLSFAIHSALLSKDN